MDLARLLYTQNEKKGTKCSTNHQKLSTWSVLIKWNTWIIAFKVNTMFWLKLCGCHAMKIRIRIQCVGFYHLCSLVLHAMCLSVYYYLLLPVAVIFFFFFQRKQFFMCSLCVWFGQFKDGVRLLSQFTSIFGHLVWRQVIIGFDMDTERKSLSNSIAEPW